MISNFSKLQLWRDTTISYFVGVGGALVVVFSLDNNSIQPKVFWAYLFIIYLIAVSLVFFVTKIFRNQK